MSMNHETATSLDEAIAARLGVDAPLPEPLLASLTRELDESHCHALPASMIPTMVLAQRLRDASMAEVLAAHATTGASPGSSVLIAGDGRALFRSMKYTRLPSGETSY